MQTSPYIGQKTFLWYDLETYGLNTRYDRIAQFAAQRTDMQLNPIGDEIVLYGKVSDDYLPDPMACLITGITPMDHGEEALPEDLLIAKINKIFSEENTIVCGYNTINFDDEMVRSALYRNFYDPYEREWKHGCSRWDIIDLVRAAFDFKHDSFEWPDRNHDNGNPVFKLTALTKANGIDQTGAHDAMVDVKATIALAKLIKERQPKLFDWSLNHRSKEMVKRIVTTPFGSPFLLTSSRFTSKNGCTALVTAITPEIDVSNAFLCFDLSQDVSALISASDQDLFHVKGLFTVAANRCPFVTSVTPKFPDEGTFARLGIDKAKCLTAYQTLKDHPELILRLRKKNDADAFPVVDDTDFQIYSGSFFSDGDKERFETIHSLPPDQRLKTSLHFDDSRVDEMLFRHVCRNYPEVLDEKQKARWKSFCANRLLSPPGGVLIDRHFFNRKIEEGMQKTDMTPQQKVTLDKLRQYGNKIKQEIFD